MLNADPRIDFFVQELHVFHRKGRIFKILIMLKNNGHFGIETLKKVFKKALLQHHRGKQLHICCWPHVTDHPQGKQSYKKSEVAFLYCIL